MRKKLSREEIRDYFKRTRDEFMKKMGWKDAIDTQSGEKIIINKKL